MPNPSSAPTDNPQPLQVLQVADVPPEPEGQPAWLVEHLWARQAVGVLGGAPKTCKTFMALEMALAVASGRVKVSVFVASPVAVGSAHSCKQ